MEGAEEEKQRFLRARAVWEDLAAEVVMVW